MKFICLGHIDEEKWALMSEAAQQAFIEECLAYDDELRRGKHFIGGEALGWSVNAVTVKLKNGKAITTDGPFSETKEVLGGILFLEANDMNHAIALMSKHPGLKAGPFEIRPSDEEINKLIDARTVKG